MGGDGAEVDPRVGGVDGKREDFSILLDARVDSSLIVELASGVKRSRQDVVWDGAESNSNLVAYRDILERIGLEGHTWRGADLVNGLCISTSRHSKG